MNNNNLQFLKQFRLLFIALMLFSSNHLFADGSKNLYPSGVLGGRAFLYSNSLTTGVTITSWPFKTIGTHYAYVKEGEILHAASSAQGSNNGRITLTAPDGTVYTSAANTTGQITNRTAELAGPRLSSQGSGGNRYSTFNRTATASQTGIWKIELLPTSDVNFTTTPTVTNIAANADWSQSNNSALIAAWDVSVEASGSWISGRVYTNVINLHISSSQTTGFYGNMYALTKDGYIYKVSNNGNNGVGFTFFINNNGFFTDTTNNIPAYKSKDFSNGISSYVQSPLAADTTQNITHKIFYSQPASDLPVNANGSVPGGDTWLKNAIIVPNATNIGIVGLENTPGQVSTKGGYINFTAGSQGAYTIIIESTSIPSAFTTKTLTGTAVAGNNSILWDGKDGNNTSLPSGNQSIKIKVQLRGAEVHFPFIDMEINPNGIVLELLNGTDPSNERFRVYWDDIDVIRTAGNNDQGKAPNPISANVTGELSGPTGTGGHMWGQQLANTNPLASAQLGSGFGNNKSIDTWSYIKGTEAEFSTTVAIKTADLKVSELISSSTTINAGSNLTYTIKVKNDGPSDVVGAPFTFTIPAGLDPQSFSFLGNGCGAQTVALTYNPATQTYISKLDLPNGCEITYTITVKVTAAATPGNLEAQASILRPNDVTDPDATNTSIDIPPTNAQYECTNNGLAGICNNIRNIDVILETSCVKPGTTGLPTGYTKVGILTKNNQSIGNWPNNVPNGHIVLDSAGKGLVITHMTTAERDLLIPVNGMLIYNTTLKCVELYRGTSPVVDATRTGWNCIIKGCNN